MKILKKIFFILSFICLINVYNSQCYAAEVSTELVSNIIENYIYQDNSSLSQEDIAYLSEAIIYYSYQYGIDPFITTAVISTESHFHQSSRSGAGAIGLGQLMPDTARAIGVNPNNISENIEGTCSYLSTQMKNFYNTDYPVECALAAYNAGPKAVIDYGGIPPYPETQNYVNLVRTKYFTLYNTLCNYM